MDPSVTITETLPIPKNIYRTLSFSLHQQVRFNDRSFLANEKDIIRVRIKDFRHTFMPRRLLHRIETNIKRPNQLDRIGPWNFSKRTGIGQFFFRSLQRTTAYRRNTSQFQCSIWTSIIFCKTLTIRFCPQIIVWAFWRFSCTGAKVFPNS